MVILLSVSVFVMSVVIVESNVGCGNDGVCQGGGICFDCCRGVGLWGFSCSVCCGGRRGSRGVCLSGSGGRLSGSGGRLSGSGGRLSGSGGRLSGNGGRLSGSGDNSKTECLYP